MIRIIGAGLRGGGNLLSDEDVGEMEIEGGLAGARGSWRNSCSRPSGRKVETWGHLPRWRHRKRLGRL